MSIKLEIDHHVTDEERLRASHANPGYQFERTAEGKLVVSPTGSEGGRRSMEGSGQLHTWNRGRGLGVVFDSSTGFSLPDGSCLLPDASCVRRERWDALPTEVREGFAPLCPDAVFEVRSWSDTLAELHDKLVAYLANGARIAVLVDPWSRSVEVWRPGREPEMSGVPDTVDLGPELPAFGLNVAPVFA